MIESGDSALEDEIEVACAETMRRFNAVHALLEEDVQKNRNKEKDRQRQSYNKKHGKGAVLKVG